MPKCVQQLPRVSSLVRALCLMTPFRLTIRTRLVPLTADKWRVTIKAAWFPTMRLSVVRTRCLDLALSVEAVLLRTSNGVPPSRVWVTVRCRCRLLESSMLPLLIRALRFLGNRVTKLTVQVLPVVPLTLLCGVLVKLLQVTPPVMALSNSAMRRAIRVTRPCRPNSPHRLILMLLTRTLFPLRRQKCGTRPVSADPLSFECLISVITRFGLIEKSTLPSIR